MDRGAWNDTIHYRSLGYYSDWRCNLNRQTENSFGLGIWPTGNVKISITVDDWGVVVAPGIIGKAMVFGFTLLEKNNQELDI